MKQLFVSLAILSLYGLADVVLTAVGLKLGLRETNPFVPVDHLFLHWVIVVAFTVIDVLTICAIGKKLLAIDLRPTAQRVVSLITMVYVCVLIHNTTMIWRVQR